MKHSIYTLILWYKAIEAHGENITPSAGRISWSETVTYFRNKVYLWYNTPDNSTHIVSIDIK